MKEFNFKGDQFIKIKNTTQVLEFFINQTKLFFKIRKNVFAISSFLPAVTEVTKLATNKRHFGFF